MEDDIKWKIKKLLKSKDHFIPWLSVKSRRSPSLQFPYLRKQVNTVATNRGHNRPTRRNEYIVKIIISLRLTPTISRYRATSTSTPTEIIFEKMKCILIRQRFSLLVCVFMVKLRDGCLCGGVISPRFILHCQLSESYMLEDTRPLFPRPSPPYASRELKHSKRRYIFRLSKLWIWLNRSFIAWLLFQTDESPMLPLVLCSLKPVPGTRHSPQSK